MVRKIFSLIVLFLMAVTVSFAQKPYRVQCGTYLNVRQGMSSYSKVLGTLQNNQRIEVYEINGDWAKIHYRGEDAYVSIKYLVPIVEKPKKVSKLEARLNYWEKKAEHLVGKFRRDTTGLLWGIVPLILMIYLLWSKIYEDRKEDCIIILSILALALSLLEIGYSLGVQKFTWFCSEPRWWWIVVNFLVFSLCTGLQIASYLVFIGGASKGYVHIGIFSWPAAIILAIILHFCDVPSDYAFYLILACQFIQTVIIFVMNIKYANIFQALLFSLVYLVFTVATLIILVQFIAILIIVLAGALVLAALSGGSKSSSSSGSSSYDSSSDYENREPEYEYRTDDGAKLTHIGFGEWHDDQGRHFREKGIFGNELERIDDD